MQNFLVPSFEPRTLEELPTEPDEVSMLVDLEDAISKEVGAPAFVAAAHPPPAARRRPAHPPPPLTRPPQLTTIREHNKDVPPLGQLPADEPEEAEDAGAAPASPDSGMGSDADADESPEDDDDADDLLV